jgi:hypothetical protein
MQRTQAAPSHGARRIVATRLAVLAVAVALGLGLQHALELRLEALDELAKTDVLRARAELATLLQVIAVLVFGLTATLGVSIAVSCRHAITEERFPPPGVWSWGSRRVMTGPAARRMAQIGVGLGAALFAASAAGGGLLWYMAVVVRACRAGVS